MPKKELKPLTPQEERFVDFYFGEAQGVGTKAFKLAYPDIPRPSTSRIYDLMKRPHIRAEIDRRKNLQKSYAWLTENDVLKGLYQEATNTEDGSSSSRISAWMWIGKHLGMWQEKKQEKEDQHLQINIQSYGNTKVEVEDKKEKQEAIIESTPIPNNIKILDYKK